jgi:hypothetical protein
MGHSHGQHGGAPAGSPKIDTRERGAPKDGEPQLMDRRLFMQLLVFQVPTGASIAANQEALLSALKEADIPAVIYADANDPRGVALLTFSEDPALFVDSVRPLFEAAPLSDWTLRPELTMIGRTYSSGYEQDLEFWLIRFGAPVRSSSSRDERRAASFASTPQSDARTVSRTSHTTCASHAMASIPTTTSF